MIQARISDLQILVFNTRDQDDITPTSTYNEMIITIENGNGLKYDLGTYFTDQNNDKIGLHWSFLVNTVTGKIVNGMYNFQIQYNEIL